MVSPKTGAQHLKASHVETIQVSDAARSILTQLRFLAKRAFAQTRRLGKREKTGELLFLSGTE